MGGTRNELLVQISKEIWEYLLDKGITITAEHLPGALNKEANMHLRTVKNSSEWKLNQVVFQKLCKSWLTLDINLFTSRVSHQVPANVSCKLDPYSKGRDALQMCWTHTKGYAFPSFFLIGRVLHKVLIDQATLILITPAWQTQSWYPQLLRLSIRNPLILPKVPDLLQGPNKELHPLITKGNLQLLAWIASEGISKESATIIANARRAGTITHYESSLRKWHSWCVRRQIDPIKCPLTHILDFLTECFHEGFQFNTIAGFRSAISYHEPMKALQ